MELNCIDNPSPKLYFEEHMQRISDWRWLSTNPAAKRAEVGLVRGLSRTILPSTVKLSSEQTT